MPGEHSSVVGGSNAARVLACPGSIDLVSRAPGGVSSSYAEEGTALHSAMEYLLNPSRRRKLKPNDLLGLTFNHHTMTEALIAEAVQPAFDYFQRHVGRHGTRYELEISAAFPMIEGAFGTTDVAAFPAEDKLLLMDWKFGKGVWVGAEQNAQLMFYACCVVQHYKLWHSVRIIDMHLVQPRKDNFGRFVIDMRQLRAFRHALIRAVNGNRHLETGSHCRWCPAAPFCPARKEEAEKALAWMVTGNELGEAMAMVEELRDWCNSVTSAVHEALDKGARVPGWKLVEKRATRKWAVDDQQVRMYLGGHGLTEDQFAPRSLLSAPQAEKLLKPLGEKLKADMITAESSGYTVAPETDARPAVNSGRNINDLASFLNGTGGQKDSG